MGAEGDKREVAAICVFGQCARPFVWKLAYTELERIKHGTIFFFQIVQNGNLISSRQRFFLGRLEAFALSKLLLCIGVFRFRISRPNPFFRGAAPSTPLALPYPFPTWLRTRTTRGNRHTSENWRRFWTLDSSADIYPSTGHCVAC